MTKLRQSKVGGQPSSGARSCGKPQQNAEGAGVHSGRKAPKSSPVAEVKRDQNAGAAIKAGNIQSSYGDSAPKKRSSNSFGIKTPSQSK
jgi:hypothetical protein